MPIREWAGEKVPHWIQVAAHRKTFPVTDCGRSRTWLLIAFKLSEVSLFEVIPSVQKPVCVGWAVLHPSCAYLQGSCPPSSAAAWGAEVPAASPGHALLLQQRCSEQHKAHLLSLGGSQLQPHPTLPYIPSAGDTFELWNESLGGLLNRNALKPFEKNSRCTAS